MDLEMIPARNLVTHGSDTNGALKCGKSPTWMAGEAVRKASRPHCRGPEGIASTLELPRIEGRRVGDSHRARPPYVGRLGFRLRTRLRSLILLFSPPQPKPLTIRRSSLPCV